MKHPVGSPDGNRSHVLVVPPSYFVGDRTVGGGERYAYEYARALARLTPTTLALFGPDAGTEMHDELEVRTFRARHLDLARKFPVGPSGLAALAGFDILHLMIFPTPLSDELVLHARMRGQTIVLTDVGGGLPSWSTYLERIHPRAGIHRLAHGLAFLSHHSAAQFSDWNQPNTVLHGGAELPDLSDGPAEPQGYALFVGRLLQHKGVLELIQAIGPETPLRVVGRPYDPEYLERLRSAATGKQVAFVLDADDEELRRQYLGASVVLQPSIPVVEGPRDNSELLGLVALEGMAHGKPVIVTNAGSLPELVREGITGFIVPPREPEPLRDRIETLVRDPVLSSRMGAAARAHVAANFNWAGTAARGLELYRILRART